MTKYFVPVSHPSKTSMDQKTIPQLPAQIDSAPPAAKKTKAEISRFYRFVNSVAESIDSSNFDSVSVVS